SGGEYLALVKPDGVTIVSDFYPAFPQQFDDISYGPGQTATYTRLVTTQTLAKVFVPSNGALGLSWTTNGFDDSGWLMGTNGVGYESSVPGFAVRNYKANVQVTSIALAEGVISTPSQQTAVFAENRNVINYLNTGAGANYPSDNTVPGFT